MKQKHYEIYEISNKNHAFVHSLLSIKSQCIMKSRINKINVIPVCRHTSHTATFTEMFKQVKNCAYYIRDLAVPDKWQRHTKPFSDYTWWQQLSIICRFHNTDKYFHHWTVEKHGDKITNIYVTKNTVLEDNVGKQINTGVATEPKYKYL